MTFVPRSLTFCPAKAIDFPLFKRHASGGHFYQLAVIAVLRSGAADVKEQECNNGEGEQPLKPPSSDAPVRDSQTFHIELKALRNPWLS